MTLDRKNVRVFNRNFREYRRMSDIFIFDIDGCIMPNLFQNFTEDTSLSDTLNYNIKDQVARLCIFPEFLDFYKCYCGHSLAVYFITGRKENQYGKITKQQLLPLKKYKTFDVKFYPDEKYHVKTEYIDWKFNLISKIINQNHIHCESVHIYDDFEDLIFRLKDFTSLHQNIYCNLIQKNSDWIFEKIPII